MIALEFFTNVLSTQYEFLDTGYYNPYRQFPEYRAPRAPTHYTTEGGGTYSARPDLTRAGGPGVYRAAGGAALVVGSLTGAALITNVYAQVIEDESQSDQRGLWQMFSSGLTGTVGIGSGLNL